MIRQLLYGVLGGIGVVTGILAVGLAATHVGFVLDDPPLLIGFVGTFVAGCLLVVQGGKTVAAQIPHRLTTQ
ncbi:hypothetical protein [Halocatena marina]|uniref:Uncharacterized protein n=1 Tax=Halocatena marina TaxID=2934937 RepID=A0ABD5YLL9_9EURY|nr:hypothetical protein [Halocatena marina]